MGLIQKKSELEKLTDMLSRSHPTQPPDRSDDIASYIKDYNLPEIENISLDKKLNESIQEIRNLKDENKKLRDAEYIFHKYELLKSLIVGIVCTVVGGIIVWIFTQIFG